MRKKVFRIIWDVLLYFLGCAVYSAAVTMLISPNAISPGGLTGVSTLLNYLFALPSGVTLFIMNVPILILGLIKLGGAFIIKTAVVTTILSVTIELSDRLLPTFKTDPILAALFGGIMMGAGLGIVMLRGATTGGIDIIAKLINKRFGHLTVGRLMLFMDASVILLASLIYRNIESAFCSVIAMYASSKIMDTLLYGSDKGKIMYVVTCDPDGICDAINRQLERGVSKLNVVGGYTGESRVMLMCTVRRHEVSEVNRIIYKYDPKAFIVIAEAGEIIGEGFKNLER